LTVVPLDDLFGVFALGEVHEGEPTGTAGFPIGREHDLRRLGNLAEKGAQIGLGGTVGQVSNE
jgi:hypothetical protein